MRIDGDPAMPPVRYLSRSDILLLNRAAAHLQFGLVLEAAERFEVAARLFEIAGNPELAEAVGVKFSPFSPVPEPTTWPR